MAVAGEDLDQGPLTATGGGDIGPDNPVACHVSGQGGGLLRGDVGQRRLERATRQPDERTRREGEDESDDTRRRRGGAPPAPAEPIEEGRPSPPGRVVPRADGGLSHPRPPAGTPCRGRSRWRACRTAGRSCAL